MALGADAAVVHDLEALSADRETRSAPRESQPAPLPAGPPPEGVYTDALGLQKLNLKYAASGTAVLTLTGERAVSTGMSTRERRDELREVASLFRRMGATMLAKSDASQELAIWRDGRATRVRLPSDVLAQHGRTNVRELVEPMSRWEYLHAPGIITPLRSRTEHPINPNHVAMAGVLRQVPPGSVLFWEPSMNRLFFVQGGAMYDLREPKVATDSIAEEQLFLPPASTEAAMAPKRMTIMRGHRRRHP